MSELGFNVLGVISGVIGIFAFLPIIACWLYRRGPTFRLRTLNQMLKETESEFELAVKSGLLHSRNGLHRLNVQLWSIQLGTNDVRGEVYAFRSWWQDVRSWWRGTSSTIDMLCEHLSELRADLALTSSREKRALASTGYLNKLAHCSDGVQEEPLQHSLSAPTYHSRPLESRMSYYAHIAQPRHEPPSYSVPGVAHTSSKAAPTCDSSSCISQPCARSCVNASIIPSPDSCASPQTEPPLPDQHTATGNADYHQISGQDLRDLLSYVAARPDQLDDGRSRQRAMRKELLMRFGSHLADTSIPCMPVSRTGPLSVQPSKSASRFKRVIQGRFSRHSQRLRPQAVHGAASKIHRSLPVASHRDYNEDEWYNE